LRAAWKKAESVSAAKDLAKAGSVTLDDVCQPLMSLRFDHKVLPIALRAGISPKACKHDLVRDLLRRKKNYDSARLLLKYGAKVERRSIERYLKRVKDADLAKLIRSRATSLN
jgi:hypothetical protein